ncbi:MAG: PAS domain S-box protein [Candidatus Marsarchaeota archaeon]|nr:PAS domain S-box protein [Candidatus Marsarchaeota archaeon]
MRVAGSARPAPSFKPGDHVCWLYGSEDEHRATLRHFLVEGLAQNQKVIYAYDNHSPAVIIGYLAGEGLDPRAYLESGQLRLLNAADIYFRDGSFNPAHAVEAWRAEIDRGLAEGYTGFRLTAEMTCILTDPLSGGAVLELEAKASTTLPGATLTLLCQYDRRRFEPGFLLDVLGVHPSVICGRRVQENFHYLPPVPENGSGDPEAVLEQRSQTPFAGGESEQEGGEMSARLEISEQKLEDLIDALVDSEQRYWAMGELLPFGIWACNPRGELIYASESFLDMVGMDLEEAREFGWASVMPPEDAERILPAWRHHVQVSGELWDCELPLRDTDGRLRTLLTRGAPIRDKEGTITSWVGINLDITERKQAEEALQESEEKFRSIVEQSLDGILLIDEKGTIVEWNHAQEQITGRKREEVVGRAAWDVQFESLPLEVKTEERRRRIADRMKELLRTGRAPWAGKLNEGCLRRPDGTSRYLQDLTFPIRTSAGRMVCSMNRDVTERRLAQEAQRESEARFRTMFSDAALGIALVDPDARVLEVNPALKRMLGYSLQDFQSSTNFWDITHPDDREVEMALRGRMLAGEQDHYSLEKRYFRKDGCVVWGRLTVSLIRGANGEARYTLGMLEDITEWKQAEDARRFLSSVSDALAVSLDYEATLQSVARLAVPFLADCCTIGILEGGLCRPVAVVCLDPANESVVREMARSFPNGRDVVDAVKCETAKGEGLLVPEVPESRSEDCLLSEEHLRMLHGLGAKSAMMVPLAARGRVLGIIYLTAAGLRPRYGPEDLALAKDMAYRAALAIDSAQLFAAEQKARNEAEAAVRARDEFLSMASHELRTPITSLRGFAHMMVKQFEKEAVDPKKFRRALEVIDEQSIRLTKLISQLLDVTQIEAGRLELDREVTDIAKLVNEVAARAQSLTGQHVLTVNAPPTLLALVDALRIEQVMTNLIDNAIKYSPKGGPIDIDVWQRDDGNFCVAVRDQGIGIQSHNRAGLFTRFYQAHKHGQFGGLGLGLYLSRETVTMHGGDITVQFPDDGGTRFVVSLPIGMNA